MSKNDEFLTFEEAYRILNYDCFTGEIRWSDNLSDLKHMPPHAAVRFRGKTAGVVDFYGYINIMIRGKNYKAHRLAFLMTYERWPIGEIDHIDGNPSNNRIENLREVTAVQNCRNQKRHNDSTTGVTGVSFDKARKKYVAYIYVNGKLVHLGRFSTIPEAAAIRQAASEEHGYHELHGTVKNG